MKSLLTFFVILFTLTSCKAKIQDEEKREEFLFTKHGELSIVTSQRDSLSFDIEIADTPEKNALGLMYRYSMQEKQAMFFLFDYERTQAFWMKNTYIPLDIIFIDSNLKIVSIVENCEPLNEESLSSQLPALYALEINAGLCRQLNIEVGQTITYKDFRNNIN